MKKFCSLYLLMCTLCFAQYEGVEKNLLYSDVRIEFRDGNLYSGFLSGLRNDSLVFLISGNEQVISYENIRKLAIRKEGGNLNYTLTGFFGGILLGNLLFYTADEYNGGNQPASFAGDYPEDLGAVLINTLFGAAGMLIGYVFDLSAEGGEKHFDFPEKSDKRHSVWNSLQSFLMGGPSQKRIQLSFHAGHISNRIRDIYRNSLEDAGFEFWYPDEDHISFFNFLRKIQLLFEVQEKIKAGAALIWQGEPALVSYDWPKTASITNEAIGYYALCQYQPISKFPLFIGAGLGVLDAKWRYDGTYESGEPFYETIPFNGSLDKSILSGVIFSDYHINLTEFSFLSISMDHTFTSPQEFPEIPEIGLSQNKRSYGNTNIGIALGLRF